MRDKTHCEIFGQFPNINEGGATLAGQMKVLQPQTSCRTCGAMLCGREEKDGNAFQEFKNCLVWENI